MAQNISLMGATYSDVPAVTLPKSGGGTARFDDCSIVTATASDVASGKLFVASDGTITTGTASGGGGSGLVYESGTYSPSSNVATATINFQKQHTELPIFVMLVDTVGDLDRTTYTNYYFSVVNWYTLCGTTIPYSSSGGRYATTNSVYRANSTSSTSTVFNQIQSLTGTTSTALSYFLTTTNFSAYTGNSNRYWRTGRTYKWVAIWKP